MKFKKAMALMMGAGMAVCALAGCSGGGDETTAAAGTTEAGAATTAAQDTAAAEEGETAAAGGEAQASGETITFPLEETMEFTSFSGMDQDYTLDDNLAMKTAMENANINIIFNSVLSADLTEKRNLLLASGEYPDMFFKAEIPSTDLEKYGKQGIFIPLEDLIRQYAPNLTAVLDEREGWQYITASDGHIYSLPGIIRPEGAMTTYWINKRWMDNLGLEEPKSFDELYEVLKAFKEQDANGNGDPDDEIPLTCTDVCVPELLLAYADYGYDMGTKTSVIDGELTYIPTNDRFKDYITFVTKLYQEGLLDKNAFTQKHEQQGAIGQSGDVLGSFFDAGAFLTVGRDNDDDYIALTPFQDGTYPLSSGIIQGTMAITDACENPEILVAWADQFYSEEGGILTWMGVEGKTYQINEEGDWEWIVGAGYGDDIAAVRASNTIQGSQNHPSIQPDFWYSGMSAEVDPDEVYLNGERAKVAAMGAVPLPMMTYTEEENSTMATLKTDIDAYIQQYVAQVATGELNLDESWDTYVETMNAMGAQELAGIYQAAYARAVAE